MPPIVGCITSVCDLANTSNQGYFQRPIASHLNAGLRLELPLLKILAVIPVALSALSAIVIRPISELLESETGDKKVFGDEINGIGNVTTESVHPFAATVIQFVLPF